MPILHYFGADGFGRSEAYNELRAAHDADGALAANSLRLDGARTSLAEITAAARTVPFLAAYRLIRVDGLCRPYELPYNAPPGRRRRTPQGWDDLPQRLQDLPETSILVFLDDKLDKGNPMRGLIAEVAQTKEFRALNRRDLSGWVHARARSLDVHLTGQAERALVDRAGSDLATLASELDKLRLYAGDATVDEHVIRSICPRNPEAEIWDLTDAVAQGRSGPALRALETLRADGRQSAPLLGALGKQMREIILAQEILAQGGDAAVVRERLRINHPYPAQKLTEQAQRFTPDRPRLALRRIRECSAAIQRYRRDLPGGLNDDLALELLVVDLASG